MWRNGREIAGLGRSRASPAHNNSESSREASRDLGDNLGSLPLDIEAFPRHVADEHSEQMLQRRRRSRAYHMLLPARAYACAGDLSRDLSRDLRWDLSRDLSRDLRWALRWDLSRDLSRDLKWDLSRDEAASCSGGGTGGGDGGDSGDGIAAAA